MKNRSIEEIQRELDNCYNRCQYLKKEGYSTRTNHWRSSEYIDEMNLLYRHIRNLQLELNRVKHKNFGKEVREKRRKENVM